jgi:hypothetical protein
MTSRRSVAGGFGFNTGAYGTGPYGGGAINTQPQGAAALGGGPFAPAPLNAKDLLQEEFIGVVQAGVIDGLGEELGPGWMWKVDPLPLSMDLGAKSTEDLKSVLLSALEEFESRLNVLPIAKEHGGARS